MFEFGPDGLEFSEAAVLEFDVREIDPNAEIAVAKIYYYDPDRKDWTYQGTAGVSNGIASFPIEHFSKYAISD